MNLRFYDVASCGYYERGADLPIFGEFGESVDEVLKWVNSRNSLADTLTEQEGRTYCYSCVEGAKDTTLLVIWNGIGEADGSVLTVDPASKPGEAAVGKMKPKDGGIPGFPTYFWLLPKRNVVATLQFDNRNGSPAMQAWFKSFLQLYNPKHAFTEEIDGEHLVTIRENKYAAPQSVSARFALRARRDEGPLDFIRANREDIAKVVRKAQVPRTQAEMGGVSALLEALFEPTEDRSQTLRDKFRTAVKPGRKRKDFHYRFEVTAVPTEDELEHLIGMGDDDDFANIGIQMTGASSPIWVSDALEQVEFEIEMVETTEDGVLDVVGLLTKLEEEVDVTAILAEAEPQDEEE